MWVPIGSPPFSFMRWNREQKHEPRDRILSEHLYERQKYKAGMRIRIKARRTRYPGLGCFPPQQIGDLTNELSDFVGAKYALLVQLNHSTIPVFACVFEALI